MAARAHERLVALPHVPGERHVAEDDRGRRRPVHPLRVERREGAIGAARDLAGGLGQRRGAGAPREERRVEVLLVPELRTERILLEEVHVVEALGRMVAGVLHQGVVRALHVREAAACAWAARPGLGLGDLRLGQAEDAAGARPGVAADEDRAVVIPGDRAAPA